MPKSPEDFRGFSSNFRSFHLGEIILFVPFFCQPSNPKPARSDMLAALKTVDKSSTPVFGNSGLPGVEKFEEVYLV